MKQDMKKAKEGSKENDKSDKKEAQSLVESAESKGKKKMGLME